jgi:hypothetical protein
MHLCGSACHQVELLAGLLDGADLAAKLRLAIRNGNDLVSLRTSDRARIVGALPDPPPSGLAELRTVLVRESRQDETANPGRPGAARRSRCATRENAPSREGCYGGAE